MTTKEYEELMRFLKDYCGDYIYRLPIEEEIKDIGCYYEIIFYEWRSPRENITIRIADNLKTKKLTFIFEDYDENLKISKTINNTYFESEDK